MNFLNKNWSFNAQLEMERPLYLRFDNTMSIYTFIKNYNEAIENEDNQISFYNENTFKLELISDYITNLISIDLNNRKSINYLHKCLISEVSKSDDVFEFEEIKYKLIEWLDTVKRSTLIDFAIDDNIDLAAILKLFSVKFAKRQNTLYEVLIKYLELLLEISKVKIILINFAFYILSEEEIKSLIDFCKHNNLYLIFIEKDKICYNLNVKVMNITEDELLKD